MPKTHSEIISLWPTVNDFAQDVGVKPATARTMKARNSIDSAHWFSVVRAAKARGYRHITVALLASTQPGRRQAGERVTA